MAVKFDVVLRRTAGGLDQRFALGNLDLRLHNINACDFFCNGVFDLNTRVYLNEIKLAAVHIHQEFNSTGTFVIHVLTDFLT